MCPDFLTLPVASVLLRKLSVGYECHENDASSSFNSKDWFLSVPKSKHVKPRCRYMWTSLEATLSPCHACVCVFVEFLPMLFFYGHIHGASPEYTFPFLIRKTQTGLGTTLKASLIWATSSKALS